MKKAWEKWKIVSAKILDKEATIILSFLYIILISPISLIYKLLADPLNLNKKRKSFWFEKDSKNISDLKSLKNQY